jgi:hypothetical protein
MPHRPHGLPWTEARKDAFVIAGSTDDFQGPSGGPENESATHPCGPERPASTRYPRKRATAMKDTRKLPSERLIPSCSGPAACMKPGQPSLMRRKRFAASGHRLAACGYRQNPCFKSPTRHGDLELLVSWPSATDEGQPLSRFPNWNGCLHLEQSGIETEMKRPPLSPPMLRQRRRQPHHLPGQG